MTPIRTALCLVLALSCLALSAQTELKAEVKVEAEANFGVHLDHVDSSAASLSGPSVYLENLADLEILMTIREKSTEEFGEGRPHGWIRIGELELYFRNEDMPGGSEFVVSFEEIEAEVRFGPYVYMNLQFLSEDIGRTEAYSVIEKDIFPLNENTGLSGLYPYENGLSIGTRLLDDTLTVEFGVLNDEFWQDGSPFVIQTLLSYHPKSFISLDFIQATQFEESEELLFGLDAQLGFNIPLGETLTLHPIAGFSFVVGLIEPPDIKATLALVLDWSEAGVADEKVDIPYFEEETPVSSGFSLAASYLLSDITERTVEDNTFYVLSIEAGFYEDPGDRGLLPVFGGSLVFNANVDLLRDKFEIGLGCFASFDLGIPQPYFGVVYTQRNIDFTAPQLDSPESQEVQVKLGVEVKNLIRNTTLFIDWSSGDLTMTSNETIIRSPYVFNAERDITGHLGLLKIGAKIAYRSR